MEVKLTDPFAPELLKAQTALMQVMDPELCVNIIDLGLVYGVDFSDATMAKVTMTLTTQGCPMGEAITRGMGNAMATAFPDREIKVDVVWEPHWNFDRITDAGKVPMGLV